MVWNFRHTHLGGISYTQIESKPRDVLIGWGNLVSLGGILSMFSDNNTGFTSWLTDLINGMGLAWWVKIETKTPLHLLLWPFSDTHGGGKREGWLH